MFNNKVTETILTNYDKLTVQAYSRCIFKTGQKLHVPSTNLSLENDLNETFLNVHFNSNIMEIPKNESNSLIRIINKDFI